MTRVPAWKGLDKPSTNLKNQLNECDSTLECFLRAAEDHFLEESVDVAFRRESGSHRGVRPADSRHYVCNQTSVYYPAAQIRSGQESQSCEIFAGKYLRSRRLHVSVLR